MSGARAVGVPALQNPHELSVFLMVVLNVLLAPWLILCGAGTLGLAPFAVTLFLPVVDDDHTGRSLDEEPFASAREMDATVSVEGRQHQADGAGDIRRYCKMSRYPQWIRFCELVASLHHLAVPFWLGGRLKCGPQRENCSRRLPAAVSSARSAMERQFPS